MPKKATKKRLAEKTTEVGVPQSYMRKIAKTYSADVISINRPKQKSKIRYTKPEAVELGTVAPVVGATCYPHGRGVLGGHCDTGNTAGKQCKFGNSAAMHCHIGSAHR